MMICLTRRTLKTDLEIKHYRSLEKRQENTENRAAWTILQPKQDWNPAFCYPEYDLNSKQKSRIDIALHWQTKPVSEHKRHGSHHSPKSESISCCAKALESVRTSGNFVRPQQQKGAKDTRQISIRLSLRPPKSTGNRSDLCYSISWPPLLPSAPLQQECRGQKYRLTST